MEEIVVVHTEAGLSVEGFPNAVAAISLSGPVAQRLAGLWLHKMDLSFAIDSLDEINHIALEHRIRRESLWRSSVVHYAKCFGDSKSRFRLHAKRVFRNDSTAISIHRFMIDLRDKHLIHDENAFAQSLPGALLNDGTKVHKIEKIVCFASYAQTLNQQNWSNLRLLASKAHDWVVSQFDLICDKLTEELEQLPYADLRRHDEIRIRVPSLAEVGGRREVP